MGHVTDTIDAPQPTEGAAKRRAGGLNAMLVADLKTMAASLGVAGGTGRRPFGRTTQMNLLFGPPCLLG